LSGLPEPRPPVEKGTPILAHEIETFNQDGTAAFFSARQDAWHQLGSVTPGCLTAQDVMQVAYLGGWQVLKEGLRTVESGAAVPNRYATTRAHPKTGQREVLGLVGASYQVVQNEQACELLDMIVDETGAHYETAGSLRGGREVFVTMKLPDSLRVAGVDAVDLYLVMCTTHDVSRAGRILVTPVRVVCANTQRAAFANNHGEYTFRHSGDVLGKLADVRAALGLVPVYLDQFQAAAEAMMDKQLEGDQLKAIAEDLWPLGEDDGEPAYLKALARERDLKDLFETAPTQDRIRGTAWSGYQAITEWPCRSTTNQPAANTTAPTKSSPTLPPRRPRRKHSPCSGDDQ
jgi:phage/plasmid-like protein (TIGR03299 family)